MSKRILSNDIRVYLAGEDITNHVAKLEVDHTPGHLSVGKLSFYITAIYRDTEGNIVYRLADSADNADGV